MQGYLFDAFGTLCHAAGADQAYAPLLAETPADKRASLRHALLTRDGPLRRLLADTAQVRAWERDIARCASGTALFDDALPVLRALRMSAVPGSGSSLEALLR